MPKPRLSYYAARRKAARELIDSIRASTVCARCGCQPIEWHHPDHINRPHHRLGEMVSHSLDRIRAEIAACTPYCRRCHMEIDGRMAGLRERPTHCGHGHEYKHGSYSMTKSGARRCNECRRENRLLRNKPLDPALREWWASLNKKEVTA